MEACMIITRKDVINYHLLEPAIEKNKKKLERYKDREPGVTVGKVKGFFPGIPVCTM